MVSKSSKNFDRRKAPYCMADPTVYVLLKENAKKMRQYPTDAEAMLWRHLIGNQLGKPFRRQHIILDNIVDFVCLPAHLIVEIDGGYHDDVRQQYHDALRTEELEHVGFKVIRFTNNDVFGRLELVLETIKEYIK